MPQETVYFRITLQDAQNYNPQFNPYEIAITKKVSWLIDFWDIPLCGQSRARQLIKQIAGQGESGKAFLKALRAAISRRRQLVRETKMLNTLDALSHEISRYVGRL